MVKPAVVESKCPAVHSHTCHSTSLRDNAVRVSWNGWLAKALYGERPATGRLKETKWAPTRTWRLTSVNAGSPTRREGAPHRARWYPWHSQEELRGGFLGHRLTWCGNTKGTTACRERSGQPKTWDADARQDPHERGKTGLSEIKSPIGAACPPPVARLSLVPQCAGVKTCDSCNLFAVGGDRWDQV